jgi:hypothetical protein
MNVSAARDVRSGESHSPVANIHVAGAYLDDVGSVEGSYSEGCSVGETGRWLNQSGGVSASRASPWLDLFSFGTVAEN